MARQLRREGTTVRFELIEGKLLRAYINSDVVASMNVAGLVNKSKAGCRMSPNGFVGIVRFQCYGVTSVQTL